MITFLSIGTNLGDKEANIKTCIELLKTRVGALLACSEYYYSQPQGFVSKNDFINIVAKFSTTLSPYELLYTTQAIERQMGRTEKSYRVPKFQSSKVPEFSITENPRCESQKSEIIYHDRIIDIDILLYDQLTLNTPELTLPHPRMNERDFVIIPLKSIL